MKRSLTAKEEQDILDQDPKYQAMMAEKERVRAERREILRRDEEPLVEALTNAGWSQVVNHAGPTRSVWDLVNTTESYPQLLDTLADHLSRPYRFETREGIARALTVREARGTRIPQVLMDELKKVPETELEINKYGWCLINALLFIGDASMIEEVRQLLGDPRYAALRKDLRLDKLLRGSGRRTKKDVRERE